MDLFSFADQDSPQGQPLAEKLRPRRLEDLLGQSKIVGANSPWRRLVESGQIPSMILWGPPGSGKTTFALLLSLKVKAEFITVNAVETGAKALRELGDAGRRRRIERQARTLLFVDEIHRLNKGQQDVLLPFVEKGDLILVGATTENPSYEINSALLSRCRLLVFERLDVEDMAKLTLRAAGSLKLNVDDVLDADAKNRLYELADGDGRRLLNILEVLFNMFQAAPFSAPLTPDQFATSVDLPALRYDKTADLHYDTVSAFIKSVRGSDPDAAIYYLARMLKGGEDPVFVARRLVILASEDIGNADPRAISVAVAGLQAVELVGMPEAAISLAQVTTYMASAPKSNRSYEALQKANALIDQTGSVPIPLALRSAKTSAMKNLGYGKGYKYPHDGETGYVRQRFLPEELGDVSLYEPVDRGFEKNIRQYLAWVKGEPRESDKT
jgi:putative ATPase